MISKNIELLNDFIHYCIQHPEERFWQALRNWAKADFICRARRLISNNEFTEIEDTFYFEGRDK
jgi:hypothetical protein